MSRLERPPADIEIKGGPAVLAPRHGAPEPDTGSLSPEGVVELIAAVTGGEPDAANDVILEDAFAETVRRTNRRPWPKLIMGHQWDSP